MQQKIKNTVAYTAEQREWLDEYLRGHGPAWVTVSDINTLTKVFNSRFISNRTITGIAAQLRLIKTKMGYPTRIVYRGISGMPEKTVESVNAVDTPKIINRIPALLNELGISFKDLIRQNGEMRSELKKLAAVRSAIDKYRNGGK